MSIKLSCLPQSKALLSLYDDISEVNTFDQIIPPVSRSIDLLSDTLYGKCMDKLTGRDNLLDSLEGVIVNTGNPNPNPFEEFVSEFKAMPPPFEVQPFEWPKHLDSSCMVKIDLSKVP